MIPLWIRTAAVRPTYALVSDPRITLSVGGDGPFFIQLHRADDRGARPVVHCIVSGLENMQSATRILDEIADHNGLAIRPQ